MFSGDDGRMPNPRARLGRGDISLKRTIIAPPFSLSPPFAPSPLRAESRPRERYADARLDAEYAGYFIRHALGVRDGGGFQWP